MLRSEISSRLNAWRRCRCCGVGVKYSRDALNWGGWRSGGEWEGRRLRGRGGGGEWRGGEEGRGEDETRVGGEICKL